MTAIQQQGWAQSGDDFKKVPLSVPHQKLLPGIYRYVPPTPMLSWRLNRIHESFEMPFDVIDLHANIQNRTIQYLKNEKKNLGVLLNGLKGTGKSVSMKIIANRVINEFGWPIIIIDSHNIPLDSIIDAMDQPFCLLFDEFEKNFNNNEGHQVKVLSILDGLNSPHQMLSIFTTNNLELNANLKNRPGRIRYRKTFNGLTEPQREMLIDRFLKETQFRDDCIEFFNTNEVNSIDVLMSIVSEVNLFKEPPQDFVDCFNVTESNRSAFIMRATCLEYPDMVYEELVKIEYSADVDLARERQGYIEASKNWIGVNQVSFDDSKTIAYIERFDTAENAWVGKLKLSIKSSYYSDYLGHKCPAYSSARIVDAMPSVFEKNGKVINLNELDPLAIKNYFEASKSQIFYEGYSTISGNEPLNFKFKFSRAKPDRYRDFIFKRSNCNNWATVEGIKSLKEQVPVSVS